jgi:hypothetical protein
MNPIKRVQVVSSLVEGTSINAMVRIRGADNHMIINMLEDMGCAFSAHLHRNVRGLRVRHLQCDEI